VKARGFASLRFRVTAAKHAGAAWPDVVRAIASLGSDGRAAIGSDVRVDQLRSRRHSVGRESSRVRPSTVDPQRFQGGVYWSIGIIRAKRKAGAGRRLRTSATVLPTCATEPPTSATTLPTSATEPPTSETGLASSETRPASSQSPGYVQGSRQTPSNAQRRAGERLPPTGGEPRETAGQGSTNALKPSSIATPHCPIAGQGRSIVFKAGSIVTPLWPIVWRQRGSENMRRSTV
jgi:hypothetical protein